MATIIGFSKWTDQGVRNYRETVDRLEQAKELAKRFDAEITATYWTPGGPYDMITVLEASDQCQGDEVVRGVADLLW